jgi:hypothetical protein
MHSPSWLDHKDGANLSSFFSSNDCLLVCTAAGQQATHNVAMGPQQFMCSSAVLTLRRCRKPPPTTNNL